MRKAQFFEHRIKYPMPKMSFGINLGMDFSWKFL